jgi:predicted amidohydrolase
MAARVPSSPKTRRKLKTRAAARAPQTVRVAAIQAAPVLLDLERTTARLIELMAQAAARGARLVAFGETWLPGYPAWLDVCPGAAYWNHPPAKKAFARLMANSVTIPGPEITRIARAAKKHDVVVVLGVHERVKGAPGHGTLFNTQLIMGSDGTILSRHRKLMPTFAERLVWGQGDGSGLDSVATSIGRVGSLICWEHWMPLARQAVHRSGEQIHVACWPSVHDLHQLSSRHYAFEGRCFVLAVGQIIRVRDLPKEMELPENLRRSPDAFLYNGGTAIYGPDGGLIVGPVYDREEIVVADLDLSRIAEEAMALDVTGHYDRPDVFEFRVRA